MKSPEELVVWAENLSTKILEGLEHRSGSTGAYWVVSATSSSGEIRGLVASALNFLRVHAGENSEWYERAKIATEGARYLSGAHEVGAVLRAWVRDAEDGVIELKVSEGTSARGVASTDVMEQVRELIRDRQVHPAAPIVLAGAALETALRGAVEEAGLAVDGKPGISTYGKALRSAEVISKQDVKDIEQMGGLRNDAAHGHFDSLSPERAGLMEQQVNLFLARLATLLGDA